MLKAIIKKTRDGAKVKIHARRTYPAEAAVLMARICEDYIKECPGLTLEKLLGAVRVVVREDAEEEKGGLNVVCYVPEDECEYFDREDGWCNRFDRPCAEIHDAGEAEDE